MAGGGHSRRRPNSDQTPLMKTPPQPNIPSSPSSPFPAAASSSGDRNTSSRERLRSKESHSSESVPGTSHPTCTTPTTDTSTISQHEGKQASEILKKHTNWEEPVRGPSGEILRRHNWEAYRTAAENAKPGHERSKSVRIVVRDQQVTYSTTPVQEGASLLPSSLSNGHVQEASTSMSTSLKRQSTTSRHTNGDIPFTSTPAHPHLSSIIRADSDVKVRPLTGIWSDTGLPFVDDCTSSEDCQRSTITLVHASPKPYRGVDGVGATTGMGDSWRVGVTLVCGISMVLGAAIFLRLPALIAAYGAGNILFTYTVTLVLIAIPLAYLEAGMAQFSSCSLISIWRLVPVVRGVGWSTVLICGTWCTIAGGLSAPWLHYLVSHTIPILLPEEDCSTLNNTEEVQEVHYFKHCVYNLEDNWHRGIDTTFNWPLPVALACLLLSATFSMARPKTLATIAGLGVLSAAISCSAQVMLALFLLRHNMHKSFMYILVALIPDPQVLLTPQVWLAGVSQALVSLGPGTGLLLNYSAHSSFRYPLRRYIWFLVIICLLTTALVSFLTLLQLLLLNVHKSDDALIIDQSSSIFSLMETEPTAILNYSTDSLVEFTTSRHTEYDVDPSVVNIVSDVSRSEPVFTTEAILASSSEAVLTSESVVDVPLFSEIPAKLYSATQEPSISSSSEDVQAVDVSTMSFQEMKDTYSEIPLVLEWTTPGLLEGLPFIGSSHIINVITYPNIWIKKAFSAIIFLGLAGASLSTVCGCMHVGMVALKDAWEIPPFGGAFMSFLFLIGSFTPTAMKSGCVIVALLDKDVLTTGILWPILTASVALASVHGMHKVRKDLTFMLESKVSWIWGPIWGIFIPLIILGLSWWVCICGWKNLSAVDGPLWRLVVVWVLRGLILLPIPLTAALVINSQLAYGLWDKMISSLQSSREWGDWGPQDPIEHHNWKRWRDDESLPLASFERRLTTRPLNYTHSTLSSSTHSSTLTRIRAKYQREAAASAL